jgi:MarR family transcriptional regulator for hemolysin
MQSGLTQRELADKIGIESPTLVPIIDKMEEDGYVKRKLDPVDRRVKRIHTTLKTDSLWDSIMECGSQIRKVSTKDVLEKDVKSTLEIIKKITQNLTEYLDESNDVNLTKKED